MIFYYILTALSAIWLILCVTSAITELNHIKKAKIRNFFRRIKISLREITLVWTVVIIWLIVHIVRKADNVNFLWLGISLGIFLVGLVILNYFNIFGIAKTKKRKKLAPLSKVK